MERLGAGIIKALGWPCFTFRRLSRGLVIVRAKPHRPENVAVLIDHERATGDEARAFAADYEKRYGVPLLAALSRPP